MRTQPTREAQRRSAIMRGLEFVYRTACVPENFEDYGFDFLFCLDWIAATAKDQSLRAAALRMCAERARFWRSTHPALPSQIDADTIAEFVFASYVADRVGLPDAGMRSQIEHAAKRFRAEDYFWFDARVEAPPPDVPEECECGLDNLRGATTCRECRRPLQMMSRYEVWLLALIRTYIGERYGVILGARYADALRWLPFMRPYCLVPDRPYGDFDWSIYAVTHIVYTLNDYGSYRLSPDWLRVEFEFLKRCLPHAIKCDDPETAGEIVDCLKAFGLTSQHTLIRRGEDFILSRQNPDGSWGDPDDDDVYGRYHPTIAAIDGLKHNESRGLGLSFAPAKTLLDQIAQQVQYANPRLPKSDGFKGGIHQ